MPRTSAAQLGIVASSARFKRDIRGIGERSLGLLQLHPVTIRYKQDSLRTRQYGLIAEEVAKLSRAGDARARWCGRVGAVL